MTTKRLPVYIDIINFILTLIIICSVDMLISAGMKMPCTVYEVLAFLAVIVWSYFLREVVRWLWVYLPANALMFVLCNMSSQPDLARVKVGIVVLLFCLLNVNYWINDRAGTMDIHYAVTAVIAGAYIFCERQENVATADMLYALCVIFVALEMLKMLLGNYRELALSGQLTDDMPVREIYKNNSIGAAGVMLLVLLTMICVKAEGLIEFIRGIWFSLASRIGVLFHVEDEIIEEEIIQSPAIGMPPVVPGEESILSLILHYIEIGLYVVTVAVLLYALVKFVIFVIKNYSKRDIGKREYRSFTVDNETRERLTRADSNKEELGGFFKTPTQKIRAIYRKKLCSLKKSGSDIRETLTPRENSNSASRDGHNIAEATSMYEYVRYSANPVTTKEDVARFKQLIK